MRSDKLCELLQQELKRLKKLRQGSCRRKHTACSIINLDTEEVLCTAQNGRNYKCENVVGNCSCAHAEPRAIMQILGTLGYCWSKYLVLLSIYSPCTNCANIIIDSKIIHEVVYDILTLHDQRGNEILAANQIVVAQISEVSDAEFIQRCKDMRNA